MAVTMGVLGVGVAALAQALPQDPAAYELAAQQTATPPLGGLYWLFPTALMLLLGWTILGYTQLLNT